LRRSATDARGVVGECDEKMKGCTLSACKPNIMSRIIRNLVLACALFALAAANDAPVIGILTQPYSGPNASATVSLPLSKRFCALTISYIQSTYIAASYVKYIESAGGRVVPVHFTQSPKDLGMRLHLTSNFDCVLAHSRCHWHVQLLFSPSSTAYFSPAAAQT